MEEQGATSAVIALPNVVAPPSLCAKCAPTLPSQNRRILKNLHYDGPSDSSFSLTRSHKYIPNPSATFIPIIQLPEQNLVVPDRTIETPCSQKPGLGQAMEPKVPLCRQNAGPASSPLPMVHYQKQIRYTDKGQNSLSTVVRLVSTEVDPRAETVLQIETIQGDKRHTSGITADGPKKDILIRNPLKQSTTTELTSKPDYSRVQWFLIGFSWILAVNGLIMFLTYLALSFFDYSDVLTSRFGSTFLTVNGIISLLAAFYFCVKIRKYLI